MSLSIHISKLVKSIFLVGALCQAFLSYGSHVMGGDITYKYIGNEQFSITIKVYRDCVGIRPNDFLDVQFQCLENQSWGYLDKVPRVAINEITGLHDSIESRCSSTTNGFGVEEHIYQTILNTKSAPIDCKTFSVHFGLVARNDAISTGAEGQEFFTEAIIYKGDSIYNSSPIFSTPATAYVCLGEDFIFNNGAIDDVDNDILTYKLVEPLSFWNTPIPYSHQFSIKRPLTFLGFPNNNMPLPSGFHLDSLTGDLRFRPIIANQITVLAIEVTEWRWIDGVKTIVGKTRRDMQIMVLNCSGNKLPTITALSIETCAEQKVCVSIGTDDENAGDSVNLSWASSITDATFTILRGQNPTRDSAVLCWTPKGSHIRDEAYNFVITATDNAKPLLGKSIQTITILVKKRSEPSFQVNSSEQCLDGNSFSFTNTSLNKNLFDYKWEVSDGRTASDSNLNNIMFNRIGTYNVKLIQEGVMDCPGSTTEVIKVKPNPILDISQLGLKAFYCYKEGVSIPLPNLNNIEFSGNNVRDNVFTPKGVGADEVEFKITVNGCSSDTVVPVKIFHSPIAVIEVDDDEQCFDSHEFHFKNNTSIVGGNLNYYWLLGDGRNIVTTKSIPPVRFQNSDEYAVRLIAVSDSGCADTAVKTVIVYPEPNAEFIKLKDYYCDNVSSFKLVPIQEGGVFSGKNVVNGIYKPENTGRDKVVYSISANGCFAESEQYIDVYQTPEFNFAEKIYCYKNQPIELDASFSDATYMWGDGSTQPKYIITSLGKYTVTIYHTCDTISKEVEVKDCFYGEYPNAFTPNGDGNNDMFLPFFRNAERMNLMIFNKWGEKVFVSDNLSQGWQGDYQGITAPAGTYMWIVMVEYFDENQTLRRIVERGNLTLLR